MEIRPSQIILPEGQQQHKRLTTTFGDTLSAQLGRTFGPAMAELNYYTSKSDYDPESLDRVENYIDQNSITGANAHYLRSFGIGSLDNFQAALRHIARQEEVRNDLDASTGANLFVTDLGTIKCAKRVDYIHNSKQHANSTHRGLLLKGAANAKSTSSD
jgi:hypothetical protein